MSSYYFRNQQEKKKKEAVALGYDPLRDDAPRVLASGKERIAEQIIELAKQNGIPIREDPILTSALMQIEINDTIPPELYRVVAEVLSYIYRIRQKSTKVTIS
jgi:flagellar biosynthesis protein